MHILITQVPNTLLVILPLNDPEPLPMYHIIKHNALVERARSNAQRIVYFDAVSDLVSVTQVVFAERLKEFRMSSYGPLV